jgi:hypothetical protein
VATRAYQAWPHPVSSPTRHLSDVFALVETLIIATSSVTDALVVCCLIMLVRINKRLN